MEYEQIDYQVPPPLCYLILKHLDGSANFLHGFCNLRPVERS